MGIDFYAMTGDPFDKNFNFHGKYFESNDLRQTCDRLDHLKDIRGLGVITAGSGMGKSFSLKCFKDSLNPNLYHTECISLSTVSVLEFYQQLCDKFGITESKGKPGRFQAIKDLISSAYLEKKQTYILFLDEAQYLNSKILKDLKMLMNFQYDSVCYFALVLCGEPYLKFTLNQKAHSALKQRVMIHYEFKGLKGDELREYVLFKIRAAGGSDNIIDTTAIAALDEYSQGVPRMVDRLMSDALKYGVQERLKTLNSDAVMAAADNIFF